MNYGPLVAQTLKEALMIDLSCILGHNLIQSKRKVFQKEFLVFSKMLENPPSHQTGDKCFCFLLAKEVIQSISERNVKKISQHCNL